LESGGGIMLIVGSFVAILVAATAQIVYTACMGGVLSMTRDLAV
jgi:hypothetical protein